MSTSIRDYFEDKIVAPATPVRDQHSVELAAAALLVEVVRADTKSDPAEQQAVLRAVRENFGLSEEESVSLFRLAEEEVKQATDSFQFTSLINRHFDQQQKLRVIELMWCVAYADGELVTHESQVLRRIADLLHITDGDYIAAKMKARDAVAAGWRLNS